MFRFSSMIARRLADVLLGAAFGAVLAAAALPQARETPAALERTEPSGAGLAATALSAIDGDTIEARVRAFPGQDIVARIRIDGVDAPERRGRCARETAAAEAAAAALAALVRDRPLTLTQVRGDKYFGRVVARVSAAGVGDLAGALVRAGHGRPYDGGRRESWC
ncbi:thermonuclease family protein [Methylopila henanensis]|uniref:Thermonuclease family protein n=1 Tax=Methylopila henanensis TaxID=873516 RepID=A0ABW4KAF8_9HYPH